MKRLLSFLKKKGASGTKPDACVSFPKSGRTWLRVMLDELGIHLHYTHALSGHRGAHHLSRLDTSSAGSYGKILLLYRDPRDTAVSGYHHKNKRLGGYDGSISQFIRDPHHGVEKIVHFNQIWMDLAKQRNDMLVVSYEEMKINAADVLLKVGEFFGRELDRSQVEEVVMANHFDRMKQRESAGNFAKQYGGALKPRDLSDDDSFKVRKGKVGGFREELSAEDIAFCEEAMRRMQWKPTDMKSD